jgi:hypothetical protein
VQSLDDPNSAGWESLFRTLYYDSEAYLRAAFSVVFDSVLPQCALDLVASNAKYVFSFLVPSHWTWILIVKVLLFGFGGLK